MLPGPKVGPAPVAAPEEASDDPPTRHRRVKGRHPRPGDHHAPVEIGGGHGPPQVITRQALENPPAEQTTNLQRGQAFAHDGVWAGFAVFPGGASTGWHHHGDYATYGYITSGAMTVEFGPGGRELVEIGEGDFIYIPGHLVHRESVAPDGGAGVAVRVGGAGATVFNVEGPDPAT